MGYVLVATWTAKPGEDDRVHDVLKELAVHSRQEPGCLYYQPTRSLDDPRVFLIFEIYADEDSCKAHAETEHFRRLGLEDAIPRLESRGRVFYETID